jgi:hypothetical protein
MKSLVGTVLGLGLALCSSAFAEPVEYRCPDFRNCDFVRDRCNEMGLIQVQVAIDEAGTEATVATRKSDDSEWQPSLAFWVGALSTTDDLVYFSEKHRFGHLPTYGITFKPSTDEVGLYLSDVYGTRWSVSCRRSSPDR